MESMSARLLTLLEARDFHKEGIMILNGTVALGTDDSVLRNQVVVNDEHEGEDGATDQPYRLDSKGEERGESDPPLQPGVATD